MQQKSSGSVYNALDSAKMKGIHYKITALSAMGVFLDGFDISIISVALLLLKTIPSFDLSSPANLGLLAASTVIGMLIGAVSIGYITDIYGRRLMYLWDMVIFIVFTALTAVSVNFIQMFTFRLLLGIGIGADYAISTTIIAEFSPKNKRGRLLSFNVLAWWIGYAAAFIIGYALLPLGTQAFRYMFAVGIIPAIIVLFWRRTIPESPRWLASHGKSEEARKVERFVVGRSDSLSAKKVKTNFLRLFDRRYIKATLFVAIFWFSYDVAFYGIGIFTPTILTVLGFTKSYAVLSSAVFAGFAIIGGVLAVLLVEKAGRKLLNSLGFLGMLIAMFTLFYFTPIGVAIGKPVVAVSGVLIVSMFILFEVTQTLGPGTMDFVYPQELYPTSLRATGQGLGTSISRVGAILGITTFPLIASQLGVKYSMLFFGIFALIGLLATLILAPETKGKSLEELTGKQ